MNTVELDAYCTLHPNDNLDFGSWVAEELAYLKAVQSEPKQDALRVTYVEELEKLTKLEYGIVRSTAVILLIHFTEIFSNRLETIISFPIIYCHSCQARVSATQPLQLRNKVMQRDVQLSAELAVNRTKSKILRNSLASSQHIVGPQISMNMWRCLITVDTATLFVQ